MGKARRAIGPKYPIESVDNALQLLLMVRDGDTLSVQEASRRLAVAPSTAHRLLAMLQHYELVEQDAETRHYRVGAVLAEIGLAALRAVDIRGEARPALERLVAVLDETVHLTVLRGTTVLFLDGLESTQILRAGSRVGDSLPAHATASGKALLAARSDQTLAALYPGEQLPAITKRTVTSRRALLTELAQVRRRGYALNTGEAEGDVVAVAAAIVDGNGIARGAVTVAAPASRLGTTKLKRVAPVVRATADEIGHRLP